MKLTACARSSAGPQGKGEMIATAHGRGSGTRNGVGAGPSSLALLYELLRDSPETTRTELVRRSGLSKATVSEAVAAMMASGFLRETGKRRTQRGRRQVVLEFRPRARLVLGAQFTEHSCTAVLADLRAGPLAFAERPLAHSTPEDFVDALVGCVDELRPRATAPIIGLGVGVPGLVDPTGRVVAVSVPYGWEHVPIGDMLEARLGLPTVVANRAKAAALGEAWRGEHDTAGSRRHLAYVYVGAGIVAGFVVEGRPYFGSVGTAGELGHITILPDGPRCGCGNRGCLHMLASESALIQAVRARTRQEAIPSLDQRTTLPSLGTLTIPSLIEKASSGNELVRDVVRDAGTYLGIAIATLINIMNPSLVVIGGSVMGFGDLLLERIRDEVRQRALWDALHGVAIVPSTLGDAAGPLGAAALYLTTLDVTALFAMPDP